MKNTIKVGYIRVSSKSQNVARQVKQMQEQGIDDRYIFIDEKSGKDFEREQYKTMFNLLREGDELYLTSLDRLGRNYKETGEEWRRIVDEKKAHIIVLDMPILDTRQQKDLTGRFVADLVAQILLYVAEKERENIRIRQAEGIAIAKSQGKYTGRKSIEVDKEKFEKIYGQVIRGEITNGYAMKQLGLKRNTYYRFVNEFKNRTGTWED